MATLDCSPYLGNTASYDDTTGILTLAMGVGLTEEKVTLKLLETVETQAQNKRTNLNYPICEKSYPDNPSISIVNRENATATASENQIERTFQFVGMYTMTTPSYTNAVNPDDKF
jgi:hypothetical protein